MTRKAPQLAVLCQVGVAQLHCLAAQTIKVLGLVSLHPCPQGLNQFLVLGTTDRSTRCRVGSALRVQRTILASPADNDIDPAGRFRCPNVSAYWCPPVLDLAHSDKRKLGPRGPNETLSWRSTLSSSRLF